MVSKYESFSKRVEVMHFWGYTLQIIHFISTETEKLNFKQVNKSLVFQTSHLNTNTNLHVSLHYKFKS